MVVDDYSKMDRILREERNYILQTIKKIRATGCNVVLIQKSILRDAVTDLSLHYLVCSHGHLAVLCIVLELAKAIELERKRRLCHSRKHRHQAYLVL